MSAYLHGSLEAKMKVVMRDVTHQSISHVDESNFQLKRSRHEHVETRSLFVDIERQGLSAKREVGFLEKLVVKTTCALGREGNAGLRFKRKPGAGS